MADRGFSFATLRHKQQNIQDDTCIIFMILFIVFNLSFIIYLCILCINFKTFQFIRLKFNFNFIIQNKLHIQTTYLKTHKDGKI